MRIYYTFLKVLTAVIIISVVIIPDYSYCAQKRTHSTFFEGTDYELHVYRIYGKDPGKTILIIGGIQGDEPGGFLSADLYADFSLAKGNLIVVPRANFQSIVMRQRKINEDMNRRFDEENIEEDKDNYETKVVGILKSLIAESDCLLNLHDGSGFFSEKWESEYRNPVRYGQSIIADSETYVNPDTGEILKLGDMARSVIHEINKNIENSQHQFHFSNHETRAKDSLHKEQRKSATYYALYTCGIPAFGIETSKSLSLEEKVRHHKCAVNAFMEIFGIVPETPGIYLDDPVLKYLVVSINDSMPTMAQDGQTLYINSGDTVMITHIEANYERGLSADIEGFGTINDIRKKISITSPTKIIVRKDYYSCGIIKLAFDESPKAYDQKNAFSRSEALYQPELFYKIMINGEAGLAENHDRLKLIRGDRFKIIDVITMGPPASDIVVNFKGFVGDKVYNTGEDRGYEINTAKDLWESYSLNRNGKEYQVIVTSGEKVLGKIFIELEDPVLKYIIFNVEENSSLCYKSGDTILINSETRLKLVDIITNVQQKSSVQAYLNCAGLLNRLIDMNETLTAKDLSGSDSGTYRVDIKFEDLLMGSVFINLFSGEKS